jgi:hypothetical protein
MNTASRQGRTPPIDGIDLRDDEVPFGLEAISRIDTALPILLKHFEQYLIEWERV